MLIRHYVVLILGVNRLVMWWHIDIVIWQFIFAKVFEEVCISSSIKVDIGVATVFRLGSCQMVTEHMSGGADHPVFSL